MVWAGIAWVLVGVAIALLWRTAWRSGRELSVNDARRAKKRSLGVFGLVEGMVDRHFLGEPSSADEPDHAVWELALLGSGLPLLFVGWIGLPKGRRYADTSRIR